MIDPITDWFEVTQYNNKKVMSIANLVETTWLVQYPFPEEIMYYRGGEFLIHEFKNGLIEQEYRIKTNPDFYGNSQANAIVERIHKSLGDLIRSFNPHDTDPWMGILFAEDFAVQATYHQTKQKVRDN